MSFRQIKADIVAEFGIAVSDESWLNARINDAARELYESTDLVGCLREQLFTLPTGEDQITLPFYVGDVRAIRRPTCSTEVTLDDLRPRYQLYQWGGVGFDRFRVKGIFPLATELIREVPLTFTPKNTQYSSVNVTVVGSTVNASRTSETVPVLDETSGVKVFIDIESISKDAYTDVDILVKSDDIIIALLPNNELTTRYTALQINDNCLFTAINCETTNCNCIEVLYKHRFSPFVNDYDMFPCEGYNQAIVWKFGAQYSKDDREYYEAKVDKFIARKCRISSLGRQTRINIGPNRFLESYRYVTGGQTQGLLHGGHVTGCCG